jgi:CheY-like chemotaxis protein
VICAANPTLADHRMVVEDEPFVRILVDDDTDTSRNTVDLFTELGYTIDTAEGGHKALEIAEKWPFDVGLLDPRMPGMA